MRELIAKIGKGQKASKDLTWEEAKLAARMLIEQQATPAQVGALLLGLRVKIESVAELAAFTATTREYVRRVAVPRDIPLVDLPWYGEKRETFHASIAAAITAAAAGAAILMHGHDDADNGAGPGSLLGHLGVPVDGDAEAAAATVASVGFAYLDIALYHPPVARFLELRREFGLRNVFHRVATLLNPARARAQVIGVAQAAQFEKTGEALTMLRAEHALVVRGVEGTSELSIAAGTKALELRGERMTPFSLHPRDVGLVAAEERVMAKPASGARGAEAELLRRVLANEVRGGQRDWVLLNAAQLLYVSGKADSLRAAFPVVRHALESGAGARKLATLQTFRSSRRSGNGAPPPVGDASGTLPLAQDPTSTEALTR